MDDGYTATGSAPGTLLPPGGIGEPPPPGLHVLHRRRRLGALAGVAAVALVLGIAVGALTGHGAAAGEAAGGVGHAQLQPVKALARGKSATMSAVAQRAAENAAINRTLAYTPYVRIAGAQHRELALTFDDGPGPYTPAILRVLRRLRAPATFFEVGIEDQYFAASTAAIVAAGDPVGDHTETHAPMSRLSRRLQRRELLEQADAVGDSGAPFPRLFRPPYGVWDATTLSVLKRYRMLMVLWSVDTSDYQRPGVATIVQRALDGARPGAIILLHDAGGNRSETVAALPRIIRRLRARGYRLVTVPRLLLDNPAPKDQNVAAYAFAGNGG
ncbi:MAG TPA: polysaccharide deacetylase family protein [Solirubrobacteraceae bacterium]|nr:polysaccharide deacetylase family protein [Solirubrobacteraceae bacterium]